MAPGMVSSTVCMTVGSLALFGQSVRTAPEFVDFDQSGNATGLADLDQGVAAARAAETTEGDPNAGMTWCNVCANKVGKITNPDKEFKMDNGITYTCGYLQETVNDVNPNGASGEARWCAMHQLQAKEHGCTCDGPARIEYPTKDPGVTNCNLCENQTLDFIPEMNLELAFDTGFAGKMNCGGLFEAMQNGVALPAMCHKLKTSPAAKGCCSFGDVPVPGPAPSGPSPSPPAPSPPAPSPPPSPTESPTTAPTESPTESPTKSPTESPTKSPTKSPTGRPVSSPTPRPQISQGGGHGGAANPCNNCIRTCTRGGKTEAECKSSCVAECER